MYLLSPIDYRLYNIELATILRLDYYCCRNENARAKNPSSSYYTCEYIHWRNGLKSEIVK